MLPKFVFAITLLIGGRLFGHVEYLALRQQVGRLVIRKRIGVGISRAPATRKAITRCGAKSRAPRISFSRERGQPFGVFRRLAVIHQNAGILRAEISRLATARTTPPNQNMS